MSQQEFENYLALLTRLLKVAPQQREQMAEEFRAHLEDRLDELLVGGMAKDKAVQQAIGEFGDAAVLAVELARVAQRRRRRFIMRMSYAGVGALALAGLLVFALWPEGRRVQGPQAAVAQVDAGGAAAAAAIAPADEAAPDGITLARKRIQAALEKEVQFNFEDAPLKQVAEYISKTSGVPVILCNATLADAAVTADTPVTSNLNGISLRSALRITLGELKLDYVIRDEVLQITTPEDAESQLITRVYDCRELLAVPSPPGSSRPRAAAGGGGFFAVDNEPAGKDSPVASDAGGAAAPGGTPLSPGEQSGGGGGLGGGGNSGEGAPVRELSDAESLIFLITTTVEPNSWDEVGGPGTAAEYKGLLAISQTGAVHEKVERLLNMLHASAGLKEKRVNVVE